MNEISIGKSERQIIDLTQQYGLTWKQLAYFTMNTTDIYEESVSNRYYIHF